MLEVPQWKATQFPDGGQRCRTSLYRCWGIRPVQGSCHTVNTDIRVVDFCTAVSMPPLTCSFSSRCFLEVQNTFLHCSAHTFALKASVQDWLISPSLLISSYAVCHLSAFDFFSYAENRLSAMSNGLCYKDC